MTIEEDPITSLLEFGNLRIRSDASGAIGAVSSSLFSDISTNSPPQPTSNSSQPSQPKNLFDVDVLSVKQRPQNHRASVLYLLRNKQSQAQNDLKHPPQNLRPLRYGESNKVLVSDILQL